MVASKSFPFVFVIEAKNIVCMKENRVVGVRVSEFKAGPCLA
jgi:hypothetical protein